MLVPGSAGRTVCGAERRRQRVRLTVVGAVVLAVLAPPVAAGAAPRSGTGIPQGLTATPMKPVSRVEGAKSARNGMARTDKTLLGRRSAAPVHVIVKLDYDPLAAYGVTSEGYPPPARPSPAGR